LVLLLLLLLLLTLPGDHSIGAHVQCALPQSCISGRPCLLWCAVIWFAKLAGCVVLHTAPPACLKHMQPTPTTLCQAGVTVVAHRVLRQALTAQPLSATEDQPSTSRHAIFISVFLHTVTLLLSGMPLRNFSKVATW
jgi:hypothetical protein